MLICDDSGWVGVNYCWLWLQGLDFFGGTPVHGELLSKCLAWESAHKEDRIVLLSDVWLDRPATLAYLDAILTGESLNPATPFSISAGLRVACTLFGEAHAGSNPDGKPEGIGCVARVWGVALMSGVCDQVSSAWRCLPQCLCCWEISTRRRGSTPPRLLPALQRLQICCPAIPGPW